ncbi:MAG: hypothetical protein B6I36_00680 [Desulfobacteraceae bacterium 4572_35.1]|nr:MAG: hypothetical protein B6I36_00680 [Desulfobacteraceae bacterium 4572_35.1]
MTVFAETELFDACRVLFSNEVQVSRDFLFYIQPSGVKTAYRKKARETHPDLLIDAPPEEYERQNELFRDVNQAYKLLDLFANSPSKRLWPTADSRTGFGAGCQPSTGSGQHSQENYTDGEGQDQQSSILLPRRYLETGLFLYYRGVISYDEMIEALVWQRRQRPIIGNIAENWGWLKSGDIQAINRFHGRRGRFGARAVQMGYLTTFQVQVLLRHQRHAQKRFGQYFVEQGRLTRSEIDAYIREQLLHNSKFNNSRR